MSQKEPSDLDSNQMGADTLWGSSCRSALRKSDELKFDRNLWYGVNLSIQFQVSALVTRLLAQGWFEGAKMLWLKEGASSMMSNM